MKKKEPAKPAVKRKTKSTPVFLEEEQIAFLKAEPNGISGTVRNLVFEAMNLANLSKSLKKRRKK